MKARRPSLAEAVQDGRREYKYTSGKHEEMMETANENAKNGLELEMLQTLKMVPLALFKQIVIQLLVRMGYSGSWEDAVSVFGMVGDEGISAILKEGKSGLDTIYIQAKRCDSAVGRSELQTFAAALQGKRANKGIFIATSTFTKEAVEFASGFENMMILIDSRQLVRYVMDINDTRGCC